MPLSANACSAVLILPPRLAAITPYRIMKNRMTVMPHSRPSTRMVTHHHSSPMIDSPMNAIPVSALSAIGSMSLPKSVTRLRARAMSPSIRSVAMAAMKTPAAHQRDVTSWPSIRSSSQPNSGTSRMRSVVSAFGQVPVARLSGLRLHAANLLPHARPRRGRHPTLRSRRPRTMSPISGPRRDVDDRGRTVDLRPLAVGAALGVGAVEALDQDVDPLADPVLGALRGELLGQPATCSTRARISSASW